MPAGFAAVAILCAAALLSFVLAMHCFPGGYNPAMRMLSALGRTEVRLVEWPWSHYLFMAGMKGDTPHRTRILQGFPRFQPSE